MHELGIVFYIIRDVKEVAAQNHARHVLRVALDVGEVSTIVPEYLQDCWNWAVSKEPLMTDCALDVNIIPAVTYCEACKGTYPTVQYGKICPHCQSEQTYLLRGNEVEISHIEVPEGED